MGTREVLERYVGDGRIPGAVALVARGDRVEVDAVGSMELDGGRPMARDSIFRIASITKPIVAAAVMMLVEDGTIRLDDPIAKWLPELASLKVVRTPESPVDDVVPAHPITVFDVMSSTAGYGMASDFTLPAVKMLMEKVHLWGRDLAELPTPDEWLRTLATLPLLCQPGEAFLYNVCSDIQGVLIARASGRTLPEFLDERIFQPLGMVDTAFFVPAEKRDRFTSAYASDPDGGLRLDDSPDGKWRAAPAFPSGAGGLASTADDWLRFARMLLAGGGKLLSPESVRQMTTNQLKPEQCEAGAIFLGGQGWGFGGSVDIATADPWNVLGRYGWVGGSGTLAYVVPSNGLVTILLTQRAMDGPAAGELLGDFCRAAADF